MAAAAAAPRLWLAALLLLLAGSADRCSSSSISSISSISSSSISSSSSSIICAAAVDVPPRAATYEVIDGTEVVWQRPPVTAPPRGVLLALHGCLHSALDWFPRGATCPDCIGLPEEVRATSAALLRGYMVVAASSLDRRHRRCWALPRRPDRPSVDTRALVGVLAALLPREGLGGLPLLALGASSGGAMALLLPAHVPLAGVCAQIMGLPDAWYRAFLDAAPASQLAADREHDGSSSSSSSGGSSMQQPPVMFVHMPRDERIAALVAANVAQRQQRGLVSEVVEVQPQPVTAALLADRLPGAAAAGAVPRLLGLLHQARLLPAASGGLLAADPRAAGSWRQAVEASGLADVDALQEVLNAAYAQHELVSEPTGEMLDFFEQQLRAQRRR